MGERQKGGGMGGEERVGGKGGEGESEAEKEKNGSTCGSHYSVGQGAVVLHSPGW